MQKYISLLNSPLTSVNDAKLLFPKTVEEIKALYALSVEQAEKEIKELLMVSDARRTFENTPAMLDEITRKFGIISSVLSTIKMLHPDQKMQTAAHDAVIKMEKFAVDTFMNRDIYKAFKGYLSAREERAREVFQKEAQERLSKEDEYYLSETMQDFKRNGFELSVEKFNEAKKLKKEIAETCTHFETAIDHSNSFIVVNEQDLEGISPDIFKSLQKTSDGKIKVGCDYPTFNEVIKHCKVQETRKALWFAYANRAYPENYERLAVIIQKRDELAKLLGFASYAHLDLDNTMAKSPEKVEQFLYTLIQHAHKKELKEFEELSANLPEGINLVNGSQFLPWDKAYVKQLYKEKHFKIDDRKVAEYFSVQQTVQGVFSIYQNFLSVDFEVIPVKDLWDTHLSCIVVKDKESKLLRGFIFLDLYPRDNKYTHACCMPLVPTYGYFKDDKKNIVPAVCAVIANFPKPTADKPALFKHSDVETFFHEFGHAMHMVLGTTRRASLSGLNVKWDYVEMPSQMFEEWMWDKEMLKKVSSHYVSGEPLSDDLIDAIIRLKKFDTGASVQGQVLYALLSQEFFKGAVQKDIQDLYKTLQKKCLPHTAFEEKDHFLASFGHLTGYGAKYYGYLWSKVFALDMFAHIKKLGLLNSAIGKEFVEKVLGKGGSADPEELLKDFLGRVPTQDAFLKDMGFD